MQRDRSVDFARGVAALAMIEGHAVHAWTSDPEKQSAAYAATRVVATSPLPAFMLLAGFAVALRLQVAQRRAEDPKAVRNRLIRRGLTVVGWGYLSSALYAALDGHQGLRTFLRADVLHVIGLSIVALALLCVPLQQAIDTRRATIRAFWLTLAMTLLSPLYYRYVPSPSGPLSYLMAPFVKVVDITVFPLLPMLGWTSTGFVVAEFMSRAQARHSAIKVYAVTSLLALAVAFVAQGITASMLAEGGVLDYVHPAGIPNMTGYAARGLVLIGLAPLLVACLPAKAHPFIARFGRASLIAYVFHIPFCYGLLGRPLRGELSVAQCMPFVLLLIAASYAAVIVVERLSAMPGTRHHGSANA